MKRILCILFLLLVLPANFRPITREIAPDIWHIRVLSQQWYTPALTVAQDWCWERLPAGFPISWGQQVWMGRAEDAEALLQEWRRNQKRKSCAILSRWELMILVTIERDRPALSGTKLTNGMQGVNEASPYDLGTSPAQIS